MQNKRARVAVVVAVLLAGAANVLGDWKSDIARRAIGNAARAGISNAIQDAMADAAYDAAMSAAQNAVQNAIAPEPPAFAQGVPTAGVDQLQPPIDNAQDVAVLGYTASAAVEVAMTASNVADAINTAQNVADAARAVKKVSDVARAIKSIRR